MKKNTHFKVKKKFYYEGILLRIVEREEPYMNSEKSLVMTRVLAPNDEALPIQISSRQTLTSIVTASIAMLDGFKQRGADIEKELTQTDMAKKTLAQLEAEIIELTEALKESDTEVNEKDEEIRKLKKEVEEQENKIGDLEYEVEQQPVFSTLLDQMKYDLFIEHFDKFTLEQFENLIKIKDLW